MLSIAVQAEGISSLKVFI